jgi:hypothetical protein
VSFGSSERTLDGTLEMGSRLLTAAARTLEPLTLLVHAPLHFLLDFRSALQPQGGAHVDRISGRVSRVRHWIHANLLRWSQHVRRASAWVMCGPRACNAAAAIVLMARAA